MIRSVSIVLVVAIALQTIGCAPVIQMREFSQDNTQNQIREDAQRILKKGMQTTIFLRKELGERFGVRILECVIVKAGPETLTVTVKPKYLAIGSARKCTFRYSDLMAIRYHELDDQRNLRTLLAVATVAGVVLIVAGIGNSIYLD